MVQTQKNKQIVMYNTNQLYFLFISKIIISAPANPNIAPEAPADIPYSGN